MGAGRARTEDNPSVRLKLFDFAFDHAPIGIALVDLEGRILRGNAAFANLVGRELDKLTGTPFAEFTHPDDIEADLALFNEVLAGGRDGYTIEKRYVQPQGRIVHVIIHVAAMRDATGKVVRFISQIEDISLHKAQERQLAERAAQLELAMEALRGGFWHMDVSSSRFETSQQLAQFIAGPAAAPLDLDRYLEKINPDDHHAADLEPLLSGAVDQSVAEYRLQTVAGERWMRCDRRLLRDSDGTPMRVVGVAIDMTEERRRLEASERNSETDVLTGLLNRRGLVQRYKTMASAEGYCFVAVDLDGFKTVNDRHGHAAGDVVLVAAARRLAASVRKMDLICRTGGDEFVIVSAGAGNAGKEIAERVVEAMRAPVDIGGVAVTVNATAGVVWEPGKAALETMIRAADEQLYAAKSAGKNGWQFGGSSHAGEP